MKMTVFWEIAQFSLVEDKLLQNYTAQYPRRQSSRMRTSTGLHGEISQKTVVFISSCLHCRTFQTLFQSATSTRCSMWVCLTRVGLVSPMLFSPCVNEMPKRIRHVEPVLYADDTAAIAASRKISFLVSYLEIYLGGLENWLRIWRVAINVSESTVVLFASTARRIQQPRPVFRRVNTVDRNITTFWCDL
jgi:hypothetical protein